MGSGGALCALPARGLGRSQPKLNLVHFSLKIWHLVATIFPGLKLQFPGLNSRTFQEAREPCYTSRSHSNYFMHFVSSLIVFFQFLCTFFCFCLVLYNKSLNQTCELFGNATRGMSRGLPGTSKNPIFIHKQHLLCITNTTNADCYSPGKMAFPQQC